MFSVIDLRRTGLRARYAEPHRFYHGQAHVDAMLRGLHDLGGAIGDPGAVELAIWYHDAIYDPAATDNEAQSALLLQAEMAGLADPALIAEAALMIGLTADHRLPPDARSDHAYFLDLDMAILGASAAAYDAYENGIASEYRPVVGDERYRAGRAAFLGGLLRRPRLFHSDHFHAALDSPARSNIRRALV